LIMPPSARLMHEGNGAADGLFRGLRSKKT
jgi:hypothetical protein